MIEQGNGCALLNAVKDNVRLASLLDEGHVHIIVRSGEMTFCDGKNIHHAHADDLIIWQIVIASIRTGEFKLRQ